MLGYGVLGHSSLLRLEATELRLPGQTPLQLPEGGEEPGPVGLELPVLPRDPELYGEPVAGGQLLDVIIRGSKRGQAYLLAELGKGRVSKQGHVTQELVTHVLNRICLLTRVDTPGGSCYRLRSVHGGAVVPDVLGGVEHSEGQPRQEVP